jgi:flavin-dependent dehydrogenase
MEIETMYDVIVVGARCAGSPTAMLLARKGYRVLLLDRAGFPSDTLSTHFINPPGVSRLARWGLLDKVIESNCPPVREFRLDVGPFVLAGKPLSSDGNSDGIAPRRKYLDQILVNAAVEADAELREHFIVKELLTDGERVTGIRGHAVGGGMVDEHARLVIGADGLRSFVAESVNAPSYNTQSSLTCAFYTYWSDVEVVAAEINPRPDRAIFAAPTNDGQVMTIVFFPNAAFNQVQADIEGNYMKTLELVPSLAERYRSGKRVEQFRGTAELPNFFRRPFGPGWALVGDAGYHKDPILGQGITDAFRDADLLAAAVDAGLSGQQPLDEALAAYQQQRDEMAMPGYENTLQFATLKPPPPEMQEIMAALVHNQEQTNRFLGAMIGTIPGAEFFNPENLAQVFAAAQAANPVGG